MAQRLRLLLVEDAEDDAILLERELVRGGFAPEVVRVDNREDFVAALEEGSWDVLISDYSMPRFDGLTAFELYKERGLEVPFLFVSGAIGEERAVEAMRRGVSDYLQKDHLARLVPAVQRELQDFAMRRQRRAVQLQLQASEERLRRLAQNAPDIIYEYALEPEPHFAYVSPAATAITGYTPEEHYENPGLWLKIAHDDDRERLGALMEPGGEPPEGGETMRWMHRDGRLRWVEQRTAPIYEGRRLVGIEGIVRDVTDRKDLEAQLLAAQRMEAIGRLAGGIAHDFNNMLTVIAGYCSLLRRKLPEDDSRVNDVGKIESAGERAGALVRQLLAFSRRQPRNLELLDFPAIMDEFAPMLKRVIGEDIEVHIATADNLPPVRADRSQMEQILMNLVVNARDAMPDGGRLTIETDLVDVAEVLSERKLNLKARLYLRLAVTDTGTGMDRNTQDKIFDPFFTTKEIGKGTGLGLSTVYGIVKQMEGDIWVYSEQGVGTSFKVYLPCSEGVVDEQASDAITQSFSGNATILLVEDEALLREAAEEILSAHGYTILTASDGQEALRRLAAYEREVDLLLTDLLMPHMNGVELAQELRTLHPSLRVLYTTGYSEASLPGQCSPNAGSDILQKPFGASALLSKVHEALSRER